MKDDPLRERLQKLGASQAVVTGGLDELVKKWEATAQALSEGYDLDLDSYLNDLDVRELLELAINDLPTESSQYLSRIRAADSMVKRSTKPSKCVWGETVARKEGWTPDGNWWYFVVPKRASQELLDELKRSGTDFSL
jgi:hypothetical protein